VQIAPNRFSNKLPKLPSNNIIKITKQETSKAKNPQSRNHLFNKATKNNQTGKQPTNKNNITMLAIQENNQM
jgi:hypothetical protein